MSPACSAPRIAATSTDDDAELDRHAFNAAFHELGLRWHWDAHTYERLCQRAGDASGVTRHYLRDAQSHLLKAYDEGFLAEAIVSRMVRVRRQIGGRAPRSLACDWIASSEGETGF
jgi:hypothetical protein